MAFFVLAGATVLAPGTSAKALIGDSLGGLVGGIVGGLTGGINLSSDILNCGQLNHVCKVPFLAPVSGIATCSNGICGMACTSGFSFSSSSNDCVLGASGRLRAKKSKVPKSLTLCPSGESACPIAGSASFDIFVQSTDQTADFSSAKGGYECIDTSENVESCGGCASTGQGVDVSVKNALWKTLGADYLFRSARLSQAYPALAAQQANALSSAASAVTNCQPTAIPA